MITIYGASYDLVEVEGCEGADEFSPGSNDRWQGDLIGPEDTGIAGAASGQMRVHCWYDDDGCWQVGVGQTDETCQLPAWPITITQAPAMNPDNPGYSALLSIDAPEGTRLVKREAEAGIMTTTPDPGTGPDHLRTAAARLETAWAANEAMETSLIVGKAPADHPLRIEARATRLRLIEASIAVAAIAEGMVTPDASYDVGAALQRPFPEYRDDREPGS